MDTDYETIIKNELVKIWDDYFFECNENIEETVHKIEEDIMGDIDIACLAVIEEIIRQKGILLCKYKKIADEYINKK